MNNADKKLVGEFYYLISTGVVYGGLIAV